MVLSWELIFQEERNKSRKVDRHENDRRQADSSYFIFAFGCCTSSIYLCNCSPSCLSLLLLFFIFHFIDQRNEAGTVTGKQARIEQIAVSGEGTMIVGAEIVIGTMIVIVDMIGSVTEILTAPEIMIQEVDAGHAHGLGNAPGTMIAPGIMIVTGTCPP